MKRILQCRNNSGQTLVECLVVLLIVISITGFTFIHLFPLHKAKETEYFFEQFTNDMYYFQHYALVTKQPVHIQFNDYDKIYRAYTVSVLDPLVERKYSESYNIDYGTLGSRFTYLPSGNISKSGTIFITTANGKYKIVFLLGKGRFYVKKL